MDHLSKAFSFSFIIIVLPIFLCCQNIGRIDSDYSFLNDSITLENKKLTMENDSLEYALHEQMRNGVELTTYWLPRAQRFRDISQEAYTILDPQQCQSHEKSISCNWESISASLNNYRNKILRVDPEITNLINVKVQESFKYFDSISFKNYGDCNSCIASKIKNEQLFTMNMILHMLGKVENMTLEFALKKVRKGV